MEIRNIGIMAHIDAGKTTTTERILYYTGKSHKIGNVDSGNTVTDWMPQEQERGITITSAAITCYWNNFQINLIDTPGHVDFTAEVERSLRVLDGAIVVFSAVDGVEAQTETVWKQANKYKVPRIAYINKLDRVGSNLDKVFNEIKSKLKIEPIRLQIPIGSESDFQGIIDLIKMKELIFKEDLSFEEREIRESLLESAKSFRGELIDKLSEFSEEITNLYLEEREIPQDLIKRELKNNVLKLNILPLFIGSSLKNVGVQPLLDGIVDYLPSPFAREITFKVKKTGEEKVLKDNSLFSGLVFKVQYFPQMATHLYFLRVYSGQLNSTKRLFNNTQDKSERFTRIFRIYSNKNEQIQNVKAGDICSLVGLKYSKTGDTLTEQGNDIILENLEFPEPVISVAIEPMSSVQEAKLREVLDILVREDPTFTYKDDEETGQIIISGMGELHLDVIISRMKRDFNLDLYVGKPQVTYRERVKREFLDNFEFNNIIAGKQINLKISLILRPLKRGEGNKIKLSCQLDKIYIPLVEKSLSMSFTSGIFGYPIIDTEVEILEIIYDKEKINLQAFEILPSMAFHHAFERAGSVKLEPIMKLEIKTPVEYTGVVLSTINSINGFVSSLKSQESEEIINVEAPLKNLFGYTTALRSATKGRASFSMQFLAFKE